MNKNAVNQGNKAAYPDPSPENLYSAVGLTKREYFAAMAMQGLCANSHTFWDSPTFKGCPNQIASWSTDIADSLLIALHPQGTATDFEGE